MKSCLHALRGVVIAVVTTVSTVSLAVPPSVAADREIVRAVSGARVLVSDSVWDKVTDYHKMPGWLATKSIMYAREASFAVGDPDYTPYRYKAWDWYCDNDSCVRGDKSQVIRIVINWNDGVANRGHLITAFCRRPNSKECPMWIRELPPYWGPPGPQ